MKKTVKLKFHKDTFFGSEIFAHAGEVKEVDSATYTRWLNRGAEIVEDQIKEASEEKEQEKKPLTAKEKAKAKEVDL